MYTQGAVFTWPNGREGTMHTEVRLDREIYYAIWVTMWSLLYCKSLNRIFFDHYPLLLSIDVFT